MSAQRVVIERGGLGWKVSDEEGEFAQASTVEGALRYAVDLLEGPGTGILSFLQELTDYDVDANMPF